jgi:hypothetical protein
MKKLALSEMTVDQLVDRFAEIGVAQGDVRYEDHIARFKRLYKDMDDVDHELRRRGRAARLALTRLYDHPDTQVRLKAATRTLGIDPVAARAVIQAVADSKHFPQAGEAGMRLWAYDEGRFRPD